MNTLTYLLTALKDAFSLRFLIPIFLMLIFAGLVVLTAPLPFLSWTFIILGICLWLGYLICMIHSYQMNTRFYPPLSYLLFWIGGKAFLLILIVLAGNVAVMLLTHGSVQNNQLQLHKTTPLFLSLILEFFVFLPFLYQFITSLSFLQFFNVKKVFLILKNYFLTFAGLFCQTFLMTCLHILTLLAFYIPLCLWLVHKGYNFFKEPILLPFPFAMLPGYTVGAVIITSLISLYFFFAYLSLIGQAFARIEKKERKKYEALHPVVHPEPISRFSRHYTFEEPTK